MKVSKKPIHPKAQEYPVLHESLTTMKVHQQCNARQRNQHLQYASKGDCIGIGSKTFCQCEVPTAFGCCRLIVGGGPRSSGLDILQHASCLISGMLASHIKPCAGRLLSAFSQRQPCRSLHCSYCGRTARGSSTRPQSHTVSNAASDQASTSPVATTLSTYKGLISAGISPAALSSIADKTSRSLPAALARPCTFAACLACWTQ